MMDGRQTARPGLAELDWYGEKLKGPHPLNRANWFSPSNWNPKMELKNNISLKNPFCNSIYTPSNRLHHQYDHHHSSHLSHRFSHVYWHKKDFWLCSFGLESHAKIHFYLVFIVDRPPSVSPPSPHSHSHTLVSAQHTCHPVVSNKIMQNTKLYRCLLTLTQHVMLHYFYFAFIIKF